MQGQGAAAVRGLDVAERPVLIDPGIEPVGEPGQGVGVVVSAAKSSSAFSNNGADWSASRSSILSVIATTVAACRVEIDPGRQRGRGLRMRRLDQLPGQRPPRGHRRSQPNPPGRIAGTDVQRVAQQHRSGLRTQLVGQPLGLDLRDQPELLDVQRLLRTLQISRSRSSTAVPVNCELLTCSILSLPRKKYQP